MHISFTSSHFIFFEKLALMANMETIVITAALRTVKLFHVTKYLESAMMACVKLDSWGRTVLYVSYSRNKYAKQR